MYIIEFLIVVLVALGFVLVVRLINKKSMTSEKAELLSELKKEVKEKEEYKKSYEELKSKQN